jgi:peroxiredoxin
MVIDIDRRIRMIQQYPYNTGRNFYETLRTIDTLQLTLFHQVATPANWHQGQEVFVHPGLSSSAAVPMFPNGFNELRPWYRLTPQPDIEK